MFKLGEIQKLIVCKKTDFGVYLKEEGGTDEILLPKKEVPQHINVNDEIEVFIYKDSEDRFIATTEKPMITLHEVKRLTVSDVTKIGAFLKWGPVKELLLPFKEQTKEVRKNESVLVALYIDKSERLAATMHLYPYLKTATEYKTGDEIRGTVYETDHKFGSYVAVDDMYQGMIRKEEVRDRLRAGDEIRARVTGIKEDGKLDLSLRKESYLQMEDDAAMILRMLKESPEGSLPYGDKSDPDDIRKVFGMAKNQFKRAIGRLYKERLISIRPEEITLVRG